MNEQVKDPKTPTQDIILDTCILIHLSTENMAIPLKYYLLDLIGRKFNLAISGISITELLTNITLKKQQEGYKVLSIFKRYFLPDNILIASGELSTLYKQVGIDNDNPIKIECDHISLADRIIGATAVLSGSLILTADINDFPNPYFFPVEEKKILYKRKNKENMLYLQILSPNNVLISEMINKRK